MSGILSAIWPILSSYRPNAAKSRQENKQAQRFGAFEATYYPPGFGIRRPRNDHEAQKLYNHIRTVAFWLDASPLLSDLGLPFRAGLDDVISLVPLYGDILSGILQLYQVWLSFLFGVEWNLLGFMLLNVIADTVVGIVPIIGDFLDNLFKSNLRNLNLLEKWLLSAPSASRYHILVMPETTEYIPKPKTGSRFSTAWFGGGKDRGEDERERERLGGGLKRTRRMGREEGDMVYESQVPGASGTRTRTRNRNGGKRDPVMDPLD